ncbi:MULTISPECIES: hypothetical protein [Burkholderiaceae]|uniref:Uncharacterized protein n=1 Tax=Paraburkholderia bryophila TaxID=420952 RepID=A0A329B605_9BURK|nr:MULTISPECIES: hypothetical protein [Burkholderiaceae]RAS15823.1 hypothetical protein BX591_1525 [Paraburkholderia bryophila]
MTHVDIQQAMPRVVAPGVMECGPYFERHARGGYFIVGRRQIHWYEEVVPQGDSYLLTRDEALGAALNEKQGRE